MRMFEDFLDSVSGPKQDVDKTSLVSTVMSEKELNKKFNFRLDVVCEEFDVRFTSAEQKFRDDVLFLCENCDIILDFEEVSDRISNKDIHPFWHQTIFAAYLKFDRTKLNTYIFYQKFIIPYSSIFRRHLFSETTIFTDIERDGTSNGGVRQTTTNADALISVAKDGSLPYARDLGNANLYILAYLYQFMTGSSMNTNTMMHKCGIAACAYDFLFKVMFNRKWKAEVRDMKTDDAGLKVFPISFVLHRMGRDENYSFDVIAADYVEMALKLQAIRILLDFPEITDLSFSNIGICNKQFFKGMIYSNESVEYKFKTLTYGTLLSTLFMWDSYQIILQPKDFFERFKNAIGQSESHLLRQNNPFMWNNDKP